MKDLTFEEKWGFEIWLKDFNPFLGRFEILVKDLIWYLPITCCRAVAAVAPCCCCCWCCARRRKTFSRYQLSVCVHLVYPPSTWPAWRRPAVDHLAMQSVAQMIFHRPAVAACVDSRPLLLFLSWSILILTHHWNRVSIHRFSEDVINVVVSVVCLFPLLTSWPLTLIITYGTGYSVTRHRSRIG